MSPDQAAPLGTCSLTLPDHVGGTGILLLLALALIGTPTALILRERSQQLRATVNLILRPHRGRHAR